MWYRRFDEFIVSHGYIRSPYDSCFYHRKVENGSHIYQLLYMDNMLIDSQIVLAIQKLKLLLSSEFEMKDVGAIEEILGMEIKRDWV